MTTGLTAARLAQGPEGALTPSRRTSRDNSGAFAAFDAAMAHSEDAPADSDSRSEAAATRDSDASAAADAASNPSRARTGDRLASRMAASWLAASGRESARQALSDGDALSQGASIQGASGQDVSSEAMSGQDAANLLTSRSDALTSVWTLGGATASSNGVSTPASAAPRDPLAAILAGAASQSLDAAPQSETTVAASPAPASQDARAAAAADAASATTNAAAAQMSAADDGLVSDAAGAAARALAAATTDRSVDAPRPAGSAEAAPARRATRSEEADAAASATGATSNGIGLPDQLLLAAQSAALAAASPAAASPKRGADAGDAAASSAAASATADVVARIGAALTAPAQSQASRPGVAEREPQTVSVHVVSQQSWLPPVDPNLSGGSQSFREGGAQEQKSADASGKDEAAAVDAPISAWSQPAPLSSFATLTSSLGASPTVSGMSTGTRAAEAAAAAAPTRQDMPAPPAPTLRRDLEITMTPQDLGGLQVKLKSAGDRLELAFVADRGETARMISDKSAALETQLTSAGLGLGGVAISASAAGDMSGAQTGGQGGQGSHTPSQAFGSAQGQSGGQSGGDSESTRQRQDFAGRERQDERNERGDVTRDARGPSGDRGLYL